MATAQDIIEKIHRIMLDDYWVEVREILDIVGIVNDSMYSILAEELEMILPIFWHVFATIRRTFCAIS